MPDYGLLFTLNNCDMSQTNHAIFFVLFENTVINYRNMLIMEAQMREEKISHDELNKKEQQFRKEMLYKITGDKFKLDE